MKKHRSEILISLFLIVTTLIVFWQAHTHDFVSYDDNIYVTENPYVSAGWTAEGLLWAFTSTHDGHWHPLTWLSHMTDCRLFGLKPEGHHLTSLILHLLNVLMLFFVFRHMTGALFQSAFVAALFALHPLHVEPVVWVAGRKDVLSAFFWMLALWTYALYAERPRIRRYLPILIFFAAGLMAKSMMVTLPVIFFLMDYWPLNRIKSLHADGEGGKEKYRLQQFSMVRLITEKLLLFVLVGASGLVAVSSMPIVHNLAGDFSRLMPTWDNIVRVTVSYVIFISKMLLPYKLSAIYPYPDVIPIRQAAGSGALVILITMLAVFWARRRPYFVVGWLWYLVTLIPVIRLFNIGPQSIADRYTYIPLIGLFIIIAWGVPEILKHLRYRKIVLGFCAGFLFLGLMSVSYIQAGYWKNSRLLFTHALKVTDDNWLAHYNLGGLLLRKGNFQGAIHQLLKSLRIRPGNEDAHNNLGNAFVKMGKSDKAVHHYNEALKIRPENSEFHNNLGIALELQGKTKEALDHYAEALRINPDLAKVHNNLGKALKKQGNLEQAVRHLSEAVRISPHNAEYHDDLGVALARQEKFKEAVKHLSEAVRIKPGDAEFHNNLAIALELKGNATEALHHYSEALRIRPDYAKAHYNLGNTLRQQGRLPEAVMHLKEAVKIEPGNAEFHNTLGIALAQQRDFRKAVEHFIEAVRIRPGYRNALENLELVLRMINRPGKKPDALKMP